MLRFLLFFSCFCFTYASLYLRDTAQSHYESIVDDVLGQHNEDILSKLSLAIQDPHHLYQLLKPEAEFLIDSEPIQVCVAQMPGMIANQIHEQSNVVYNRIYPLLQATWATFDSDFQHLDLANALELLNMQVAEDIIRTLEEFDLLTQVKQTLVDCHSTFDAPTTKTSSTHQNSFLFRYLLKLTWDMEARLYSGLDELTLSLYQDMF